MYENQNNQQSQQKIIKGQNDKFQFLGKNFGEEHDKGNECEYLIGIRKGDKVYLHLVGDLLELQHQKEKVEKEQEDRQLSNLERKQNLVEEFGTKKSRKKL